MSWKVSWKVVAGVLVLGLCCISDVAVARTLKIGVVNMSRAINETDEGKKMNQRLQKVQQKIESKMKAKYKTYQEDEEKLRKSWAILKDEERNRRGQASQQRLQKLRQEYVEGERKLVDMRTKELKIISSKLIRTLRHIIARDRYDYIFTNAAVLWAPEHVDLTNELIRLHNKEGKARKKKS